MEESVTGTTSVRSNDNDDDGDGVESEGEETQRHVDFAITEDPDEHDEEGGGESSGKGPNRLHRRDTPHHLKNKRIHSTLDKDKVASIIAQVRPVLLHLLLLPCLAPPIRPTWALSTFFLFISLSLSFFFYFYFKLFSLL